ncbi:hypothetical protein WAI453_007338 [Rhynchosporium graminicola]|uniref:Oxidase ustYa n=1 Tax=Rhynchosporium graminicola TaxID=2792576 RepID=A0A1E1LCM1_9HELO|nr:uncharacterized protein RCO7_08288 [Rhynchosporium commune]
MSLLHHDKQSRYANIDNDEVMSIDLENDNDHDSDTTLASDGFLHSKKSTHRISKYERDSRLSSVLTWTRWAVVIFFQGIIIMLLLPTNGLLRDRWAGLGTASGWTQEKTETGGDINGLYVPTSHKWTLLTPDEEMFVPNMTSNDNRMEIRKNWDMLMPLGSGTVSIPDWEQHPMLGKPISDDPLRFGPIFEASWTHALHCLYYTVDTYHQLVVNKSFGFGGERNDYHAGHCFEYLRNQIMCMSDMTLEGSESVLDTTGMGQAHMCRNRDEAVKWIEDRRVDDIQSIVGPDPPTDGPSELAEDMSTDMSAVDSS